MNQLLDTGDLDFLRQSKGSQNRTDNEEIIFQEFESFKEKIFHITQEDKTNEEYLKLLNNQIDVNQVIKNIQNETQKNINNQLMINIFQSTYKLIDIVDATQIERKKLFINLNNKEVKINVLSLQLGIQ